jgi:hypothetical protein
VVERFFAWISRNRRLAKDFEATIDSTRAFLYAASIMLLAHGDIRRGKLHLRHLALAEQNLINPSFEG